MQIIRDSKFNFIDKRKMGYVLSAILLIASVASLVLHGGPKYNIDFTGGILLHYKFENNVDIQELRDVLSAKNLEGEVKYFGADNEVSIRLGIGQTAKLDSIVKADIEQKLPNNPLEVLRNEKVGPKIGKELIIDALLAIFWAMLLVLIYIMWRFEFKFSIGAIAALAHDIIITMGIFSVFEIEISFSKAPT